MPDYGHPLAFGTFLTPSAQHPDRVVALARLTEQAGLDLATFQDHPYQPAFLDTWTLLSYTAASTSRITLSGNVLNLPLRQPAVLARSAASLDLLSGGRVELGLGAGGFWDAIEAMGGPRLSPGQAVDALEQAIEIIRGIWAVDESGVLRVEGSVHHVSGAKRGPAPAHRIGIWLGAYKPRMLRLTGRVADGWLPSAGYLQPGQLSEGNEIIDEAAASAGRDPVAVRRLLNVSAGEGPLQGPPARWVEALAALALQDGVSTFVVGTDDPDVVRAFGEDVAPGVRELVELERTPAEPVTVVRPPDRPRSVEAAPVADGQYERLGVTPTHDDGTRLSPRSPWDESTRPHRPESPPDVAYSATGRQVGKHLVDVHDMLRSELAQVRDLVDQVAAGTLDVGAARSQVNLMTLRQNDWTLGAFCSRYCTVVTQHHSLEDRSIFPHLREQETQLEPVLDRLAEEHLVIHDVLEGVDRALVRLVGEPAGLGPLRAAVDLLTDTLVSHLAYEEVELVEPLARYGFFPGQV